MSESRTSAGELIGFAICAIAAALFYFIPPIAYYNRFLLQNFDYGILYQSTALLARIEPPYLWNIGRHAWADDQDYLQLFLTPFHFFSSPHCWLLTVHALGIYAVGLILFSFFRGRPHLSIGLPLLFWLSPHMANMNTDFFHVEAFATILLILMAICAHKARPVPFLIFAFLALIAKEDVAVTVCAFCGLAALDREEFPIDWRYLAGAALFAVILFAFNICYVVPHFRFLSCMWLGADLDPESFAARPAAPWFSMFFANMFHGAYYRDVIFKREVGQYLLLLLWPLLFSGKQGWKLALLPLPAALINIISGSPYLIRTFFHYDHSTFAAVIIVLMFRLPRLKTSIPLGWCAAGIMLLVHHFGPQEMRETWTDIFGSEFYDTKKVAEVMFLEELDAGLPKDTVITADYTSLNYLLKDRDTVFMFSNPFKSHYFGVYGYCETLERDIDPDILVLRGGYRIDDPKIKTMLDEEYVLVDFPLGSGEQKMHLYLNPLSEKFDSIKELLQSLAKNRSMS